MASGTLSKQGISYYLRKYPKTTVTLLLLITALLLLLAFKPSPPKLLADADKPQWRGVVVGETTQQATEKILGQPDLVTHCGDVNQVEEGVYGFITDLFDCVKGPTVYMYNEEASSGCYIFHLCQPKLVSVSSKIIFLLLIPMSTRIS